MSNVRAGRLGLLLLTVCLSAMLLTGAMGAALRLPAFGLIPGYGDSTSLDYRSAGGRGFEPLTDRFLASVLGHLLPGPTQGARATGNPATSRSLSALATGLKLRKVDVTHEFNNGVFAGAYHVPSLPFTGRTQTAGATREPGDPTTCDHGVGASAWYLYTPPVDVALVANTFGTSYAVTLGVFTGTALTDLTALPSGCSTDAKADAQGNSQVGFKAHAGTSYYFQVTGQAGGGNLVFNLDPSGPTELVSVSGSGASPGEGVAHPADMSADGRFVLFDTTDQNFPSAPGCHQPCESIYVRDRQAGTTELIESVPYGGTTPRGGHVDLAFACCYIWDSAISPDGRYVAYDEDTAGAAGSGINESGANFTAFRVWVYDRATGKRDEASVNSAGQPAQQPVYTSGQVEHWTGSMAPSISADGRYVLFQSNGTNMGGPWGAGDYASEGLWNDYVHDRVTGETQLVSIDPSGHYFSSDATTCGIHSLSADGRFAVFQTTASPSQAYLRDRQAGTTVLVSADARGTPGDDNSHCPSISADGSHVAFSSNAGNLTAGMTKGLSNVLEWDRRTQDMTLASVDRNGQSQPTAATTGNCDPLCGYGDLVSLSGDGRYVAFTSAAQTAVVAGSSSGPGQSFCSEFDLLTMATQQASVSSTGDPGNSNSASPVLSADGSQVLFRSGASNFGTPNPNNLPWAYIHRFIR